ncbi:hypothetical protein ACH5RR_034516 [Cinchona calisaya]|uniref:RING-type domain-containing protein n=1 Tax=Cinchona calisaya TaxID=153742 RepID=A0ABD2YER2_9GENT
MLSLERVECSICLSEFEEGDEIRELECNHMFHNKCLEKWLQGCQATCPLCRSSVVPQEIVSEHRQSQDENQILKSVKEELAILLLSTLGVWRRTCHLGSN